MHRRTLPGLRSDTHRKRWLTAFSEQRRVTGSTEHRRASESSIEKVRDALQSSSRNPPTSLGQRPSAVGRPSQDRKSRAESW